MLLSQLIPGQKFKFDTLTGRGPTLQLLQTNPRITVNYDGWDGEGIGQYVYFDVEQFILHTALSGDHYVKLVD